MKRYLLTAASALVIAAAASAQTLQLGGEVTAQINYDGSVPVFDGPNFGGGADDGLHLKFSGSGGGWDYEVENNFFNYDNWHSAQMKLTNDLLGTFELHNDHVEYSRYFFDDTLIFEARFEPSDIEDLSVGIEGQIGGVTYGVFVENALQQFGLEIGAPFMGVNVGLTLQGDLHDTSDVDYGIEVATQIVGVDTYVYFDETGHIYIEGQLGAFSLTTDATDGDLFNTMSVLYSQDITEQMTATAQVDFAGHATNGMAALTLRF